MIIKSPAIVIKTSYYSETSLIVSLYTLQEGKIRCVAKGARRNKSPLAGKLESLNEIEAVYSRGRSDLCTLNECSLIQTRMNIRKKLETLNAGLRIIALLDDTQADSDPNPHIFDLVILCLNALEAGEDIDTILLFFNSKLIEALGYATDFDSCAICMSPVGIKPLYYAPKHGFLCKKCSTNRRGTTISAGTIQILKKIQKCDFTMAKRMRFSPLQKREWIAFFNTLFESVLEHKSVAGKIINEME